MEYCTVYYPSPRCSEFEPPLYLLNVVNATWFAIVYYYPACTLEKISALRNAGYKMMITYSYGNLHRDLDYYHGEVEATDFPISILPEEYVDYLVTLNMTSVNGDSLLVAFVSADPTTQTVIKAAIVYYSFVPSSYCFQSYCASAFVLASDTRDNSAMQSPQTESEERENSREVGRENHEMPTLPQREHDCILREFDPKVDTA